MPIQRLISIQRQWEREGNAIQINHTDWYDFQLQINSQIGLIQYTTSELHDLQVQLGGATWLLFARRASRALPFPIRFGLDGEGKTIQQIVTFFQQVIENTLSPHKVSVTVEKSSHTLGQSNYKRQEISPSLF